uniref:Uncharacterized protein n=1 Tax=Rhizophora mucronata TaxID=61149 RepID=A0A2P2MUR6_RHIMU
MQISFLRHCQQANLILANPSSQSASQVNIRKL